MCRAGRAGLYSAEDLVVGAILRALKAGVPWARLSVALLRKFLKFEVRHVLRRMQFERRALERFASETRFAQEASQLPRATEVTAPIPALTTPLGLVPSATSGDAIRDPQPLDWFRQRAAGESWSAIAAASGLSCAALRQRASRWRRAHAGRCSQSRSCSSEVRPPSPSPSNRNARTSG